MRIKIIFVMVCFLQSTHLFPSQEQDFSTLFSVLQDLDAVESEHEFDGDFFKNLMTGFMEIGNGLEGGTLQNEGDDLSKAVEIDSEKSKETLGKFHNHVDAYFQKVYVVRENFFLDMTPEDIAKSLDSIVQLLAFKPWMYVEHFCRAIEKTMEEEEKKKWIDYKYDLNLLVSKFEKDGINVKDIKQWLKRGGGFWEFISDQLALFHDFIKRCRIDLIQNQLFLEADTWDDWFCCSQPKTKTKNKNIISLKDYWENNGITVHHDFYVLGFVYSSYLFLESIRVKDLYLATRYYDENLKPIMENLRGASREADLRTYMERYKGVLDIFKAEERSDWFDDEDDKYFNELFEFFDMD